MGIDYLHMNLSEEERRLPLYVVTVGRLGQKSVHRPMGMATYQLLYTASGSGLVQLPQGEQVVREGQVLMLPPFAPHSYSPCDEGWETCWVTYSGSMAKACFPFLTDIREDRNFLPAFQEIRAIRHTENWRRRTSAYLYELLLSYRESKSLFDMPPIHHTENDVGEAVAYISENYCQTIELSTLAKMAGLSEGHFCRVFREYTHMRPIEYITHLRMELAKSLLKQNAHITISEVAAKIGYDSPGYFSYVFRKYEGYSPGEYRLEKLKKPLTLDE